MSNTTHPLSIGQHVTIIGHAAWKGKRARIIEIHTTSQSTAYLVVLVPSIAGQINDTCLRRDEFELLPEVAS